MDYSCYRESNLDTTVLLLELFFAQDSDSGYNRRTIWQFHNIGGVRMWDSLIAFYGTKSVDATHRFYADALGLSLYLDQGTCRIYEVTKGGLVGFCEHLDIAVSGRSPIITLVTDEVDEVYENLVRLGHSPKERPKVNEQFQIYHFFVSDPNGYNVEIQKFLD